MRRKIYKKYNVILLTAFVLAVILLLGWYIHGHTVAVLDPAGEIGFRERKLIIVAFLLSAIVVFPVYVMAVAIALKYRETNLRAKYNPDWDHSVLFESLWWGIPMLIIGVLSVIAWNSSHNLDPYRPIVSNHNPMDVQVIALDWKWLFIYPSQHYASVNTLEMPVDVPINFQITSDSVMNSFWIPQLGGQIYAMPGMSTQLHLVANKTGSYFGTPANIAGSGFSRMTFTAKSVTGAQFEAWLNTIGSSPKVLDAAAYSRLARPSDNYPVTYFSKVDGSLYNDVVQKYSPYIQSNLGASM
jgi:cytochrome o ubiquinol oxidase subunit II